MKRKTLTALFMLTVWSATSAVHAAGNPAGPRSAVPVDDATFKTLDTDGDGYISHQEARPQTNLQRRFNQLDTNRDGRLAREELRDTFKVERPGDTANRAAGR
jgi:hypothetical protein